MRTTAGCLRVANGGTNRAPRMTLNRFAVKLRSKAKFLLRWHSLAVCLSGLTAFRATAVFDVRQGLSDSAG